MKDRVGHKVTEEPATVGASAYDRKAKSTYRDEKRGSDKPVETLLSGRYWTRNTTENTEKLRPIHKVAQNPARGM